MKQLKEQAPDAQCTVVPWNIPRQLLVNRAKPPFDSPELRRAMVLALDRRAFSDILSDGQGEIGGAMSPRPAGSWRMPPEVLQTLPGYGPDAAKNRAEAREIMNKLGHGPDKPLAVTVTTRNAPAYRDAAVLLIGQLKEIDIDGTLNAIDTTQWYPTVMRKDYTVGVTVSENGLDNPDQQFYENFSCGAERNYTGYCSAEVDRSQHAFTAAPICSQQRASPSWLIGRAEDRTYCKIVVIQRLSALDLAARNIWTPRRNFAV